MKYIKIMLLLCVVCGGENALAACEPTPACSTLGYTKNTADCTGAALKCPWDLTKAACKTANCNIEHCAECADDKLCKTCEDGYMGLIDVDTGYTKSCNIKMVACPVLYCDECVSGDRTKCKTCKSGYILNSSAQCEQLFAINCKIANCKTCVSGNPNACSVCDSGYTLSGGSCTYACSGYNLTSGDICLYGAERCPYGNTYKCCNSTGISSTGTKCLISSDPSAPAH